MQNKLRPMKEYLKNDKVALRALEPEDIDILFGWENDEEIWEVSNTLAPFSKYILALYIKNSDKDIYESKQLRLMIDDSKGNTVGAIDLFDFDPYHQRAGIGILIHDRTERSKGYASAVLQLMIAYCFDKLSLHQLFANIAKENEISLKLFANAGFEIIGTKREWLRRGHQWEDELLLQRINKSSTLR